jgi:predicted KAP-like P-loop ATPase
LPDKAKEAFRSLGQKLGGASPLIGATASLAAAGTAGPAVGAAAGAAASLLGDLFSAKHTVQEEHAIITKALRGSKSRFLVIIDDLDRLHSDELLLVFKLVKSAGRLPNVAYLMVFDREMAEAAIARTFTSEGPHFLEKIVQASFELPQVEPDDLRDALLENVQRLMGSAGENRAVRFMNVFYDVVAPNVARPRDVVRLVNALEVTYPEVADNVDRADFLAMETLRLFRPKIHRAIYNNRLLVCGVGDDSTRRKSGADDCDEKLLSDTAAADRPALRRALMRLFPSLEMHWSNHFYNQWSADSWHIERRVCASAHFDTYFRLALSEKTAPELEIRQLIMGANDQERTQQTLREALATTRRRGGTRAALLLDELTLHAFEVPEGNIATLVTAIFGIADELDVETDKAKGFSVGDNFLRIHWLLNRLVTDRLPLAERDILLESTARNATLAWLVAFTERCRREHELRQDGPQRPDRELLVSAQAAERLSALTLRRLEDAARDGSLARRSDLLSVIYGWYRLTPNDQRFSVRDWVTGQLIHDKVVLTLAGQFVSVGWSHTAGDRVSRPVPILRKETVEEIVDPVVFRARVDEVLKQTGTTEPQQATLRRFEDAWARPSRD